MSVEVREPFPEWAWPLAWHWLQAVRNYVDDDSSPKTIAAFVDYSVRLASASRTFAVYRDGELGGLLMAQPTSTPGVLLPHVLFKRSFMDRRTTTEAARQAIALVLAAGAHKLCGLAFADNRALRIRAKRLGFREEGMLRGQALRGGAWVDVIALGMREEDFNGIDGRIGRAVGSEE